MNFTVLHWTLSALQVSSAVLNIWMFYKSKRKREEAINAINMVQEAEHNRILRRVGILQMVDADKITPIHGIGKNYHDP